MSSDLKVAIAQLYVTFSSYPFPGKIEGCPCCIGNEDREQLHSRSLRELEEEDLSRYAFKAMTTWGDVSDYKYYLPRILELLATTDFCVDTFVVLGKFEYGKWEMWPQHERDAIKAFLYSWWADIVVQKPDFDSEAFTEICKLTGDVEPLIERWNVDNMDNRFLSFVDFVYTKNEDLIYDNCLFKEFDKAANDKLVKWIKANVETLEHGFFFYEKIDSQLAEKISVALQISEQMECNG